MAIIGCNEKNPLEFWPASGELEEGESQEYCGLQLWFGFEKEIEVLKVKDAQGNSAVFNTREKKQFKFKQFKIEISGSSHAEKIELVNGRTTAVCKSYLELKIAKQSFI